VKSFLLFFSLLTCLLSTGQIVTVVDEKTTEPLMAVTFVAVGVPSYAVTNSKGRTDISAFQDSESLEIRLLGYETKSLSYKEILDNELIIRLEPADFDLDQVIISSNRRIERDRVIANRVRKIDLKSALLESPQTTADLLGTSGEVYIQKSQQGGGSPMIRGFSTNRLLIAVDGVRMNTAIFRSGNIQNVISLDPLAMEGTEVIFGPGSVIYGSDAIGGVMSFQTISPQFSTDDTTLFSGRVFGRYSTANNERTGHFNLKFGSKRWATVTSLSYSNFDDLRMGSQGPTDYLRSFFAETNGNRDTLRINADPEIQIGSGYTQTNVMQKVKFSPNAVWDFDYGFHFSTTSDIPRYDRLTRTRNGLPRSAEWNYGPQVWVMNNLNITHRRQSKLFDIATLRLAYQIFEESRISRNFQEPERFIQEEFVDAYSGSLDMTKSLSKGKELIYGIEVIWNKVESIGSREEITSMPLLRSPSTPRYPNSDWLSYGVYATYRQELTDYLSVNAGTRYNAFEINSRFNPNFIDLPFDKAELSNSALTGSLGLIYEKYHDIRVGGIISTGFRAPNVDDIGKVFESGDGTVVVPNPNLNAEYATNFELGVAKVFFEKVKLGFTAYYTFLNNALVRRDFEINGQDSILFQGDLSRVQAIQNAAGANVYGLQTELEIILNDALKFSSQFNWQQGEEELDDGSKSPLRHAAPWFGTTSLRFKKPKLMVDFNAIYNGEFSFEDLHVGERRKTNIYASDKNGNPFSPSWYTLNIRASYTFSNSIITTLGLENLTDQRYRTYSSGIAGAGRNLVISIMVKF